MGNMIQLMSNKSSATPHSCLTPIASASPILDAHGGQWVMAALTAEWGEQRSEKSALCPRRHQGVSNQSIPQFSCCNREEVERKEEKEEAKSKVEKENKSREKEKKLSPFQSSASGLEPLFITLTLHCYFSASNRWYLNSSVSPLPTTWSPCFPESLGPEYWKQCRQSRVGVSLVYHHPSTSSRT